MLQLTLENIICGNFQANELEIYARLNYFTINYNYASRVNFN